MTACLRFVMATLILAAPVGQAFAQLGRALIGDVKPPVAWPPHKMIEVEDGPHLHGVHLMPSSERLELEVELIAKVAGLNREQAGSLLECGKREIGGHGGAFLQAEMANERAVRGWLNGQFHAMPRPLTESSEWALRRALLPPLKRISPDAHARFNEERQRLEAYQKIAAALAQVAAFDECLLLSGEQRTRLLELLSLPTSDAWWRPTGIPPMLATSVGESLTAVAGGELGNFIVPEVDLNSVLRPSQKTAFKLLRDPVRNELVLEQKKKALPGAAIGPVAPGVAEADVRIAHQGPRAEQQRERLAVGLHQRIAEVDAICSLTVAQREKLRLAGQLDIERIRMPEPPAEESARDDDMIRIIRVSIGTASLPLAVFSNDGSYFQKALRGRLIDEQKQKLAVAQRERRAFQRQALIAAAVIRFERGAALTAAQCRELADLIARSLADVDLSSPGWREACLRTIAGLRDEKLRPLCFDCQLPALVGAQSQLAEAVGQLEATLFDGGLHIAGEKQVKIRQIEKLEDDPDL